jgi:hypothetical protein
MPSQGEKGGQIACSLPGRKERPDEREKVGTDEVGDQVEADRNNLTGEVR